MLAGFQVAEMGGEPGGRVGKSDGFGFDRGQLVKTGRDKVVVVVEKIRGVVRWEWRVGGYSVSKCCREGGGGEGFEVSESCGAKKYILKHGSAIQSYILVFSPLYVQPSLN